MHNPFRKKEQKASNASIQTLSVEEVKALEQTSVENGISLLTLMNRAGKAVANAALRYLPQRGQVTILTGSGNNGGDGWVAGKILADKGHDVIVFTKQHPNDIVSSPANIAAKDALNNSNLKMILLPDSGMFDIALNNADVIIDAILGTGFSEQEVKAPYDTWIRAANHAFLKRTVPILSVDCPSGLNAQTGIAANDCICAKETITMIAIKDGLVTKSAKPYVGTITLDTLGIDTSNITSPESSSQD